MNINESKSLDKLAEDIDSDSLMANADHTMPFAESDQSPDVAQDRGFWDAQVIFSCLSRSKIKNAKIYSVHHGDSDCKFYFIGTVKTITKRLKPLRDTGSDTGSITVGKLRKDLSHYDDNDIVRIKVTHDANCEVVKEGAIAGMEQKKKGLVLLDCFD